MRTLLHTEFAALLARTGTSQAGFARLTGLTPRQVNNWCRGRAAVPPWAAILAAILEERSPGAATGEIDRALRRLACRYAPDQGGPGSAPPARGRGPRRRTGHRPRPRPSPPLIRPTARGKSAAPGAEPYEPCQACNPPPSP